jgi:hypothetical protein
MTEEKLPLYQCHKQVRAARIVEIAKDQIRLEIGGRLVWWDVGSTWLLDRHAAVGGYFVQYSDDYESYSPAKAFEEGYKLVPVPAPTTGTVGVSGPYAPSDGLGRASVAQHELLQFFTFEHLKDGALKEASQPFCELARELAGMNRVELRTLGVELIRARWVALERQPIANPEQTWASTKLQEAENLARGLAEFPRCAIMRKVLEAKDCAVRAVLWKTTH